MPAHSVTTVDWSAASIEELIAHITQVHHRNSRTWLSEACSLLDQHLSTMTTPHLADMRWKLDLFSADMRMHLDQEESVLFPACIALDKETQTRAHTVDDASIIRDIHGMSDGHASARARLAELISLSWARGNGSQAAIGAVPDLLEKLAVDLVEHERLEEEILLPAVLFQLDLSRSMHTSGPFNYTEVEPVTGEDG